MASIPRQGFSPQLVDSRTDRQTLRRQHGRTGPSEEVRAIDMATVVLLRFVGVLLLAMAGHLAHLF